MGFGELGGIIAKYLCRVPNSPEIVTCNLPVKQREGPSSGGTRRIVMELERRSSPSEESTKNGKDLIQKRRKNEHGNH
jgi:hypothetical protein